MTNRAQGQGTVHLVRNSVCFVPTIYLQKLYLPLDPRRNDKQVGLNKISQRLE